MSASLFCVSQGISLGGLLGVGCRSGQVCCVSSDAALRCGAELAKFDKLVGPVWVDMFVSPSNGFLVPAPSFLPMVKPLPYDMHEGCPTAHEGPFWVSQA